MSTMTERKSLFDLGDDLEAIQAELVDAGGELSPELEVRLNAVLDEMADKVDAYHQRIKAIQARVAFHIERRDFHDRERKSWEAIEDRIKGYLKAVMLRLGVRELRGMDCRAYLQKSPPRLVLDDQAKIPQVDRYYVQPPPELNTAQVKKDLLDGLPLEGAHIEQDVHVRIR